MSERPQRLCLCDILDVDPPRPEEGIDIASVVADGKVVVPVIREISVILDGTLYTAVYDPPLKRGDKLSHLGRNVGIPARVSGDDSFVRWPDGTEAKAQIVRREKVNPNRPQPA